MELVYKITKTILLIGFVIILVFLFWQKFAPAGEVVYGHDLSDQGKFIFGLYPVGRIIQSSEWQKIIGEPVYFDVYSPRKFKQATVSLRYLNNTGLDAKFGLKLNVNDWSFYMIKMNGLPDKFVEQEFDFDLSSAERKNNKIRFVVAVPGIEKTNSDLLIDNVRVKFK
ncbi:MAG: hypothetical protein AAB766_04940 [Patescibacteria group bacterium]